jgi:predicted metal-dependent HD superfamily phosphohydrolase
MNTDKLFELAKPYLEKNDFGLAHTKRVLDVAEKNFPVKLDLQDLTVAAIILHDIGGSSIKDQYEKGAERAAKVLKTLNYPEPFIKQVCSIISTHHNHPDNPSGPFRALYDSDKLVMFSPEEYSHYNAREGFDWNKIINLIYSTDGKELAKKSLAKKRKSKTTQYNGRMKLCFLSKSNSTATTSHI